MSDTDGEESYDDDDISYCSGGYWRWASFITAETQALREMCLKTLATDHVLQLYSNRIRQSEIPKDIFQDLLQRVSVYGLHLLESNKILSAQDAEPFWKKHFFNLSSNPTVNRKRANQNSSKEDMDFKNMYCEALFLEIVEYMAPSSVMTGDLLDSLISADRESVTALLKANLKRVSLYPYLLRCCSDLLESGFMNGVTKSTKHLEFHDFFRFKDRYMWSIENFLHPINFPNLSSLLFACCKFNKGALEDFQNIIDCFVYQPEESKSNGEAIKNKISELKDMKVQDCNGHLDDDFEKVQQKELKDSDNNDVSFDEALLCGDGEDAGMNNKSSQNCNFENALCGNVPEDEKEQLKNQLNQLEFINCDISEKGTNKFCEIIAMIPFLKKLTFQPEYHCHSSLYKIFAAAFGNVTTLPLTNKMKQHKPSIEILKIHDSSLDYYCKKLLFWHKPGECKQQRGVFVPSLRHLEVVDCDLDSYLYDCHCMNHPEIVSSRILRPKISLNLPEPLHSPECVDMFNWHFDIAEMCTCNWARLETVDLKNNPLKCKGATAIAEALKTAKKLKSLNLSGCKMDTKGCACIFATAIEHPSLKTLNVSNNCFDTTTDDSLASLVEQGDLEKLFLNNSLTKGILSERLLEAFSKNAKITHLGLSANRLGNKGMMQLCEVLAQKPALSSLKSLDLSGNLIETSSVKQFALALQSSGRILDELMLHRNKLSIPELQKMNVYHMIVDSVKTPVYWDTVQWQMATADYVSQM